MLLRHRLVALIAAVLLLTGPIAHAQEFVPGTEDLPLMKELVTVDGSAVVFNKPEGRIIEATARGKVSISAVRSFYGETLPQLGWNAATSIDTWTRETETLRLDFAEHDGDLWVTFSLVPR